MLDSRRAQLLQVLQRREKPAAPRQSAWPLSSPQLRIWLWQQQQPANTAYCEPTAVRLLGPLSSQRLRTGLASIVERHESLRTLFSITEGEPRQKVGPAWLPELPVVEACSAGIADSISEFCARPFDLESGPLLRACLFRLGPEDHILALVIHHLVVDGWSADLIVRELVDAATDRPAPPLPSLGYREYVLEQRGQPQEKNLAYWKARLQGLEPVRLPYCHDGDGPAAAHLELSLAPGLQVQLEKLARQQQCTVFSIFLLSWGLVLSQWSGCPEVAVAVPLSQRPRQELERVVGLFLNTLPVRLDFGGQASLEELLQRTWRAFSADLSHQQCSLERISHELLPSMLNLQPVQPPCYVQGELQVEPWSSHNGRVKFELSLTLQSLSQGGWNGHLTYARERFSEPAMQRLLARFEDVLVNLCRQPDLPLSQLSLPDQELAQLHELQRGPRFEPPAQGLLELFAQQVQAQPQGVALTSARGTLRYGELDRLSNQLARGLQDAGVGPGQRVLLCWPRDLQRWVALLAIMKTGAAFVPIEDDEPEAWIQSLAQDCRSSLILRPSNWRSYLSHHTGPLHLPEPQEGPLALLYTSGSTGRPKAVAVSRQATLNRFHWMWREFPLAADDILCHRGPFGFVDSLWELFGGLLAGRPTYVVSPRESADPQGLAQALNEAGVTRLVTVPRLLEQLLQADCRGLRLVVSSGEALSPALAASFRRRLPGVRLLNLYGSTEVAGDITWHEVRGEGPVALGRPLSNCRVYLLDAQRRPVPRGSRGEIYLAGANLALGYWSGPETRFLPDLESDGLMFRSGDLGRWDEAGNLHYLGRVDRQLKLRGVRLQPELLEQALLQAPGVREAHVCVQSEQLIAYVVGQGEVQHWGSHLRRQLPRAYWPDRIMAQDSLPRNARGKVDHAALAQTPAPAPASQEASSPLETQLLTVWRSHLQMAELGVTDDFFELGGNSLSALGLLLACENEVGRKVPIAWLFEHPTVEKLAARLQDPEDSHSNLVRLQEGQGSPLYLVHAMGGGLDYYADLVGQLQPWEIWGFYGLDPGPHDWTLQELAERYVEDLLDRQPQGPYRLLGLSLGGSIAYQMACSLRARGREVALVIVDSYAPGYYQKPPEQHATWTQAHHWLQRLKLQAGHLLRRVKPIEWPNFIRTKLSRPAQGPSNALLEQMRRALANYRPPAEQPPLEAATLILRANYQPWHLRDPLLGWGAFLAKPPQTQTIPGMHGTTLVENPIAPQVAEVLRRFF